MSWQCSWAWLLPGLLHKHQGYSSGAPPPGHMREPDSTGTPGSGWESSGDNTLTTRGDRHSMRPLENTSDEVIRRKYCFLWWWEKSAFWYVAGYAGTALFVLSALRLEAQDSAFQNSTGAIWAGDQSASKSGEWYQIQMLGTRSKWSPPALKQLGWGPHIHHGQNGHKRWKHLRWSPFLWQKRKWGREPTLLDILFLGRMSKSKSMMKATPFSEQQGPIFTTENTADSIFQESLLLETFFIF